MKISILTPTYNRAHTLTKLYESMEQNLESHIDFEWLIMDDGSTDNTKELISKFIQNTKFTIKYFTQKNQGKMQALNNLVPHATGDLIVEIDSDDYFTHDAFKIIVEKYKYIENDNQIYAMVFLRETINGNTVALSKDAFKTKMFDLYFKYGLVGDTTMVFKAKIRKEYIHKLENNEKFITEARMYNEIERDYFVMYFTENISICEYLEEGYSKNIYNQFLKSPFGYFSYFKEILQMDTSRNNLPKEIVYNKALYLV